MQQKEKRSSKQSQAYRKTKSIKVLHSNAHADRPKISMEGKWLEQLGFHIGDRLLVEYVNKAIFISHIVDPEQPLAVHEPSSTYLADANDLGKTSGCRKQETIMKKHIKVTSSIHVRQNFKPGESFYYPEHSKISMEGRWLDAAGFHTGDRIQVEYWKNAICIYPAA